MSLLDALLLDPAPFDTWVAYRSDGVNGSGTLNDPWNGSTGYAAARSITSLLNNGGDSREAIATARGHRYADGDAVTISGVTGQGAARWNGTFSIYGVVAGVSFKYYMTDAPAAAPTQGDQKVVSQVFWCHQHKWMRGCRFHGFWASKVSLDSIFGLKKEL